MVLIYALECLANGKAYIGSTKGKLGKRMREHRCLLNAGLHKTAALQADWRLHGEAKFVIRSIQEVGDDLANRRHSETEWMERYRKVGLLYNEHIVSMRPIESAIRLGIERSRSVVGNRWTPEANEKRRMAQLGKPKGHGAKISATKRRLGQRPSLEAARKGGIAAIAKRQVAIKLTK